MYHGLPVKDIKVDARGLENLKRIVLPDGIESITKCWMQGSPSFVSINFPDGLKTIGKEAFLISATGTANLTDIRLPSTLTSIGGSAFLPDRFWSDDRYQKHIYVAYGNPVYHSQDHCLIETQTKTLIMGTALSVIPTDGSVTKIGYGAFLALPDLITVTIPDAIIEIDAYAFLNCKNLESIHFGASYTPSRNFYATFGNDVWQSTINQITVSENNPWVYAVNNCLIEKATKTLLLGSNSAIIPTDGSVTKIGEMAFRNCTFDTIYIPVTIKEIARGAFLGTCMVNDDNYDGIYGTIYYEGTVAEWEQIIIGGAVFDHNGGPDREIPVVCSDGTTSVKSVFAMIA